MSDELQSASQGCHRTAARFLLQIPNWGMDEIRKMQQNKYELNWVTVFVSLYVTVFLLNFQLCYRMGRSTPRPHLINIINRVTGEIEGKPQKKYWN